MKGRASLAVVLLALAGAAAGEDKPPFYRSYLVPGNPLDERIRAQEKRVEEDPGNAALRNDFGNLLAARGFAGDARKQYKQAMTLDKGNFLAPYNLGLLEETQGKISAAISAYEESIKRKPGFPPSRFHLGRLYERKGLTDRAIEQYSRALRIDPSMRNPRRNPLVADTQLLDRVSLTNYDRDLATASLSGEARFAEEARLARVPVDRALFEGEVEGPPAPTPSPAAPVRAVAPAPAASAPAAAGPPPPGAPPPSAAAAPPSTAAPPPPASATPPPWSAAPPPPSSVTPAPSRPSYGRPIPPPTPTPR